MTEDHTTRDSPARDCAECAAIRGDRLPEGGFLFENPDFVVHGVLGGSPLPGWIVIAPRRHLESIAELSARQQARWFELAALVDQAQRAALGAEKVYIALFAEVIPHLHLHLVPRYADTPAELRGPRCFLSDAGQQLSPALREAALDQVRRALATSAG